MAMNRINALFWIALTVSLSVGVTGEERKPLRPEDIARESRTSVVVISSADRTGEARGIGTGFVVRSDGVIATNYHVIGDRRPVVVQLAGGGSHSPEAVLAVDRIRDLALIQIDVRDLPVLELGNSDGVRPGQEVIAIGNPLGLEWSVSRGVVAATREVDRRQLIQVAIPLEPGSSGSPLIDLEGDVVGMLAIKSGAALGFAIPVNELKRLLERPRPIAMSRWLTIGALDTSEWRTPLGGHWRQRAGRLTAAGVGEGFGGRMLCLSEQEVPGTFELEVEVRLEDESGAAGLVFHSDGKHRHYGFYPTGGSLRLTRFEGPVVFTWTILRTVPSDAYLPGEWNRIRVRVDGAHLTCSVNGAAAIDLVDPDMKKSGLTRGKVGVVKFRAPAAEFRGFRVGEKLEPAGVPPAVAARVEELIPDADPEAAASRSLLNELAGLGTDGARVLLERASALESRASFLRALSRRVHEKLAVDRLRKVIDGKEEEIDLLHAALLVASLDNPDLEVEAYLRRVDRMAGTLRGKVPAKAAAREKMNALIQYLFEDLGFHASHLDYYHRSNSYLNEVLEDREGIPITLSIVFMELARRIDLPVVGLGIPRHFIVGHRVGQEGETLIDVFNDGKFLDREQASELSGVPLGEEDFRPASRRSIIVRMLRNLTNVAEGEQDRESVLRYLDAILAIDAAAAHDRWRRAQIRFQTGDLRGLSEDLERLAEHPPAGLDPAVLRQLREFLDTRLRQN